MPPKPKPYPLEKTEAAGEMSKKKKLSFGKPKMVKDVVPECNTETVFVMVNAKIQPAQTKLRERPILQESGKPKEEESDQQQKSLRLPLTGVQVSPEDELKQLLLDFNALQEENKELVKLFRQLKNDLRAQHDAVQRDSSRLYDLLKTSAVGQELSAAGSGSKPVSSGQESKKSSGQDLLIPQPVHYKKVNHMRGGQAIPRFIPEVVQPQVPTNPAPKANVAASSDAGSGINASGPPPPPANVPANVPAPPAAVRKPKSDVTSCYLAPKF
ncbi:hypothetical protein DdX_18609 [Ditylenchus destructor]|uniref:Uncharacterized protein n=1 Tax=Ditylenchus destructor TaxID=166010 RepID=A0AAD4MJW3_9BILA|nr:hypothetical protein DdX_18609 [Ditylenchus destructor]